MIGPTGAVRVMVATRPVDFRKGAEGLATLVRETIALAAGGLLQTFLPGQARLLQRGFEAMLFLAAACLFRAAYRWVRGHDGLGLGDVKFATAGVLWIGIDGVPQLLLVAVLSALASLVIMKAEGYDLHRKQAISFGPHLATGLWVIWIAGPSQAGF